MKVIFQQGLENMAGDLGGMGFEMHPMHENVAADAILYTENLQHAARARVRKGGALMLNVRGLSAAQTAEALRRRSQSPLF